MIDLKKKEIEPVSDIACKINLHKEPRPAPDAKSSGTETPGAAKPGNSTNQAGSSPTQSGSNNAKEAWLGCCFGYCGCLGMLALFAICLRSGLGRLILGIATLLVVVCGVGAAMRKK